MMFRTELGAEIFNLKYAQPGCRTWDDLSFVLSERVMSGLVPQGNIHSTTRSINRMQFIPAGRYLYYANRPKSFFNNCFAFRAHDSRESWSELAGHTMSALMCGGGIGVTYGDLRCEGAEIKGTGGVSSGPMALMAAINEIGRNVKQGGSRRSAMFAGLPWSHPDIQRFIQAKIRTQQERDWKANDYNFPLPFDMTNMSMGLDDQFLHQHKQTGWVPWVFRDAVHLACQYGEPGFTFDFAANALWTQRNA